MTTVVTSRLALAGLVGSMAFQGVRADEIKFVGPGYTITVAGEAIEGKVNRKEGDKIVSSEVKDGPAQVIVPELNSNNATSTVEFEIVGKDFRIASKIIGNGAPLDAHAVVASKIIGNVITGPAVAIEVQSPKVTQAAAHGTMTAPAK